jgi:hypothetical protein
MTSLVATLTARDALRNPSALLLRLIAVVCLSFVIGRAAIDSSALLVAAGVVLITLLASVAMLAPLSLLYGVVAWLVVLGFTRRVAHQLGFLYYHDPLLLIGPTAVGLLLLVATWRGAFKELSPLAATVLGLNVLFVAGVVNPIQGSPLVGVAGLLFTLVPMLGFWIGRGLVDTEVLKNLLRLAVVLAIGAAGYGFYQVFQGFPSWDLQWIKRSDYAALYVFASNQIGTFRPFGTLASASEFVLLLAIGVVVCLSYLLNRRGPTVLLLVPIGFLLVGITYGSSRSVVVTLGAASALIVAARRGLSLPLAATFGAALVLLLPFALSPLIPTVAGGSPLLAHQVEGLADPLNPRTSTLRSHVALLQDGVRSAISDPLGQGAGSITLAADRFGSKRGNETEADPSNVGVALGIPGLVLFLALFVLAFRSAYRVALARRDPVSLAVLGVLTVTSLQWLNGGLYAVSLLTWIALGWADKTFAELNARREGREAARPNALI